MKSGEKQLGIGRTRLTDRCTTDSTAERQKLITGVPMFPQLRRIGSSDMMKGRAITLEEFERMLSSVEKVILKPNSNRKKDAGGNAIKPPADDAWLSSWRYLMRGL